MKRDLMGVIGAVALYALLMGLIESEVIGAFWQLNLICINIILAVSLNLITGAYRSVFDWSRRIHGGRRLYVGGVCYETGIALYRGDSGRRSRCGDSRLYDRLADIVLKVIIWRLPHWVWAKSSVSLILNIPYVGGASGLMGIPRYTTFTWAFFLMVITVLFIKNFINSSHGQRLHLDS